MREYELDKDEEVILETEDVTMLLPKKQHLDKLILTNKNIRWVYGLKASFFAAFRDEVEAKRALNEIKHVENRVYVSQVKTEDGEICLNIQYADETDRYVFDYEPRQDSAKWVDQIHVALIGMEAPEEAKPYGYGAISTITEGIKGSAFSAMRKVSSKAKKFVEDKINVNEEPPAPEKQEKIVEQQGFAKFCPNCGERINPGSKFCSSCGNPILQNENPPTPAQPESDPDLTITQPIAQRTNLVDETEEVTREVFAGVVLKCPNCGAAIDQGDAVCPTCGHHITGRKAINSIKELSDKLMTLEAKRKAPSKFFRSVSADPVDKQKLTLIQAFPIPNTVDDIREFILLAIANIDIKRSKNTLFAKMKKSEGYAGEKEAVMGAISDAWVSKLKQAYKQAKIGFHNDPDFKVIEELYLDEMKELKMDVGDDN